MIDGDDVVRAVKHIETRFLSSKRQEVIHVSRCGSPSFNLCGNVSGDSEIVLLVLSPHDHVSEATRLPVFTPACMGIYEEAPSVHVETKDVPTCDGCLIGIKAWAAIAEDTGELWAELDGVQFQRDTPIPVIVSFIRQIKELEGSLNGC